MIMDTQTQQEMPVQIVEQPQVSEPVQTTGWKEQLAGYRLLIIIGAILFAGSGALFLSMQSKGTPPENVAQEDSSPQSPPGTGGSISLSIADDPDILEAELEDLTGTLDGLDNEIAQME